MILVNESNGYNLKCDKRLLESACGHIGFNISSPHLKIKPTIRRNVIDHLHTYRFYITFYYILKCEQSNYTCNINAAFVFEILFATQK